MIDKAAVRTILTDLVNGRRFSEGELGIEQATNYVLALDRPAITFREASLIVTCPYCGRTPGNACQNARGMHPSRLRAAMDIAAQESRSENR